MSKRAQLAMDGLVTKHHLRMHEGQWQCFGPVSWITFGRSVTMVLAGFGATPYLAYRNFVTYGRGMR